MNLEIIKFNSVNGLSSRLDGTEERFSELEKREKIQIISIRTKTGNASTDPADIQRIIKEYYKQLYTCRLDNLDKINHFLQNTNYHI